jgi:ATP-binding cassette subfamily B (MDR/TAP) protein 1
MADYPDEKLCLGRVSSQPSEPATKNSSRSSQWRSLFAFTDHKQTGVITCAVVTAAGVAVGKTVYTYFLGRVFDVMARYGADLLSAQGLLTKASQWCGYTTVLGMAVWALSSVDLALWITSGELRASTARKTLFASLLQKEMDWFDSRAAGVSSTLIQTQG